jgi:hypothetical protein
MVWGFCYLRIFKKMHSISGRRYRVNSKYVTILKPQDLQEVNKPKMWLNILNSESPI